MSNPTACTFWLDNRQVTGVTVAEYGQEKLVEYSKRIYVIKDKNPNKKHYTQSTLPAFWKKIMKGETPPPPSQAGMKARTPKKAAAAGVEKPAAAQKQEEGPPAAPAAAAAPPPGRRNARPAKPKEVAKAAPPVEKKPTARRKAPPSPTPSAANPDNITWLVCPYCQEAELISVLEQEVGKAHIRACRSCKKEFGVRIVPKTTYHAETAAFQEKS